MKKDKEENKVSETTENGEIRSFFFPDQDRVIKAHSMEEAQKILQAQMGEEENV